MDKYQFEATKCFRDQYQ